MGGGGQSGSVAVASAVLLLLTLGVHGRQLKQEGKWDSMKFQDEFVRVEDGEFVVGKKGCGRKFPISGFNVWEVVEAASLPEGGPVELPGSGQLPELKSGKEFVNKVLDDAVDAGYTVVRAWAHGVTEEYQSMDASGNINEGVMAGLDYFMAEAYKRGLKVILSFTSNWTPAGGVDFYAEAVGKEHNDFFTDPGAKELYKKFVEQVVTRKNTITGVSYNEDPTVFGWNLINEPVCRGCEAGTIANWVNEMAPYVKGLDSNHLLTVGEEGYYSTSLPSVRYNPMHGVSDWPLEWTQDFLADHENDNIDFASFHAWPDNWNCMDCGPLSLEFFSRWISHHEENCKFLGKPCLLEEFGKENPQRDEYYRIAYDAVDASLREGGSLKGALFWQYYLEGQKATPGEIEEFGVAGPYGVYKSDSAFDIAKENAKITKELYTGSLC